MPNDIFITSTILLGVFAIAFNLAEYANRLDALSFICECFANHTVDCDDDVVTYVRVCIAHMHEARMVFFSLPLLYK